ncbi:MAG TPA: hypothetical protein VLS28_01475 [Candidatus Sulfomarinibacteraceae bacterium]|nr:hypothetical protein [Candidatus Sulfomarinibacteraceae bacterium]
MIHQPAARHRFPVGAVSLAAVAFLLVGFALAVAQPQLARLYEAAFAVPSPSPSPTSTPAATAPMALGPGGVTMAEDADCGACHIDATGEVTTKQIPPLAHPLEGWKDCTACHANDRLVKTAAGHSSLHKEQCLACHKVPSTLGTAPPRPHHLVTGAACASCHGTEAPLPTDMAGRTNCWICHSGTEFEDLFAGPAETP